MEQTQPRHLDSTVVTIPRQFLSWLYRRHNKTAKLNIAFTYTDDDDVEISFIAGIETHLFNIEWSDKLRTFILESLRSYLRMERISAQVFEQAEEALP
jgi:hypothetical protein